MNHHDHGQDHQDPQRPGGWSSRGKIAFAVFLAIALFFLLSEHRAHLFGFLPFLLLLACPLIHLFHHGGHGSHGHPSDTPDQPQRGSTKET